MNMKKKLLVVFTGPMELGGIEKSLIGLLDAIDYEQYSVDLFLYGFMEAFIPRLIKMLISYQRLRNWLILENR